MGQFELYFRLGTNHILDLAGFDHILFVLVLSTSYSDAVLSFRREEHGHHRSRREDSREAPPIDEVSFNILIVIIIILIMILMILIVVSISSISSSMTNHRYRQPSTFL